jgi:hypothetical protein
MNEYYQITRGIMEFSNANPTEPVLNIVLTTTINQYNLSLIFPGPLDKMQTSYLVRPAADSRQFNRPGTDHAGSGLSLQPWGEFPAGARGRQPGKQRRPKTGRSLQLVHRFHVGATQPWRPHCHRKAGYKQLLVQLPHRRDFHVTRPRTRRIRIEQVMVNQRDARENGNGGFAADGKYHKKVLARIGDRVGTIS